MIRSVYHEGLGFAVFPGMVSSSNARFARGVVMSNAVVDKTNGCPFGLIMANIKGLTNDDAWFKGYVDNNLSTIPNGVLVYNSLDVSESEMRLVENTSTLDARTTKVLHAIPGQVVNVMVQGKAWVLSEKTTTTQHPMTRVQCYYGLARADIPQGKQETRAFYTGTPCVKYAPGWWLHEVIIP